MKKLFLLKIKPVCIFNLIKLIVYKRFFNIQLVNQNNHLHVKIFFHRIAILRNYKNGFKVSIHQSLARISCVFSDHVLQPRGHTPGKPRRGSPSIPRVTSCPGRAVLRCISKNFPGTGSAGLFEIHKINQLGAEKRA
jgi:hypothetical protein